MKQHSLSLIYRIISFKDEEINDSSPLINKLKQEKEAETYFDTSESDCDFYLNSEQTIVERTTDNAFGRFDELLGSGSFKQVYRGYDFNSGREIAWSIINISSDSSDYSSLQKITDEINILKQLDHPNIIHFIKGWFDESKNQIIIITELVSGGSLRSNLKRLRELRLRLVKKWIKDILAGLEYLHQKNIIHRDIKCDNIFLDNIKGTLKLGDLGGSQLLKKQYATHYIGTEQFMSPEVYEGKYTVKADIYSLGMSIIEMLTLEKPYKECEGPMVIYYNITHGIFPESLAKIKDEKITKFIKLCLLRENERPTSTELLRNEFLNDTLSEENNRPVKIVNYLRQNIISSKKEGFDIGIIPLINLKNPQLIKATSSPKLKQKPIPIKIDELNTCCSTSPISSPTNSILHTLPEKNKRSKFIVTIKEPPEMTVTNYQSQDCDKSTCKNDHFNDVVKLLHSNTNEVEINFIVKREEWKNKKLLRCSYNLDIDTIDGLALELQKAIDLNENECQIVKHKLNESLTHYTSNSNRSSQRNTMIPVSEETLVKDSKQKIGYHSFQSSFNYLSNSIRKLLNDDETKLLDKYTSISYQYQHNQMKPELIDIIKLYKSKQKVLMNIINVVESSNL